MKTRIRLRATLRLAFASGTLALGLWSPQVRAEPGDATPVPPARYSSLPAQSPAESPAQDPAATGSLPDARSPGNPSGFQAQVAQGAILLRAGAPTGCLPGDLREVVADVAARFGPVSVESTHRGRGHNRRAGGAGGSMHLSCRAVDFRVKARARGVMAYLSARPEVGGLKIYRNGIIHIDNGARRRW
jgi:hypothetical protein